MDVGVARQALRVDLDHRADHHDLPLRVAHGHGVDQLHVDALVDDAAVTQPRTRQLGLQRVVAGDLGEVGGVDAARKAVHARVPVLLGPVQAGPAGEHQVRLLEQHVLALHQLARRVLEERQLVHAVVDDPARLQLGGQRHGHRRVEPDPVVGDLRRLHRFGDEALQHRDVVVVEAGGRRRHVRPPHLHPIGGREPLQPLLGLAHHRLFDEDHSPALGQTGQQVLRPLVDEVPAEVGKDEQGLHGWGSRRGLWGRLFVCP